MEYNPKMGIKKGKLLRFTRGFILNIIFRHTSKNHIISLHQFFQLIVNRYQGTHKNPINRSPENPRNWSARPPCPSWLQLGQVWSAGAGDVSVFCDLSLRWASVGVGVWRVPRGHGEKHHPSPRLPFLDRFFFRRNAHPWKHLRFSCWAGFVTTAKSLWT